MKIVLDTNVLLQCIGINSIYRPIWDAYLNAEFELSVSVEIVFEYWEKLEQHTSFVAAKKMVGIILASENTILIRHWTRWNIITVDADDNKFFDIAIASNANYLVTNDAHFNVAKQIRFPKVNVVSAPEFLKILTTKTS